MGENPRIRGQLSPVGIFFLGGRGGEGENHIAFIANGGGGSVVSNRVLKGGQRKVTTTKRRSLHSYRDVKEGQGHFIFLQLKSYDQFPFLIVNLGNQRASKSFSPKQIYFLLN